VKPSPVPEPQSFTNRAESTQRWRARAMAICPITQSRPAGVGKRKRLSVATEMSRSSRPLCQDDVTHNLAAEKPNSRAISGSKSKVVNQTGHYRLAE
jgi:hypothetical protein